MNKNDLRIIMKAKRSSIDWDNDLLVSQIKNTQEYIEARNIMLFYPMKNEVNLLALMKDKSKNFFLPRVNGTGLECCPFCEGDKLILSKFKTQEPMTQSVDKKQINLVLVPALCCDKNNYRLGYGGGFYDRFLKDYNGISIVALPKDLIIEYIPIDQFDISVNKVITF